MSQKSLSFSDSHELRQLVDHAHPQCCYFESSLPRGASGWPDRVRQSAPPRQGGASVPSDQAASRLSEDPAAGHALAEAAGRTWRSQ